MKKLPNSQSGFTPIIAIIIIVIILALGGLFYFRQNKSVPKIIENTTQNLTSSRQDNLRTYQNTKYGFKFNYDRDSSIVYEGSDGVLLKLEYPANAKKNLPAGKTGQAFTGAEFAIERIFGKFTCDNYVQGMKVSGQVTINGKTFQIYNSNSNKGGGQYNTATCLEGNGSSFLLTNLYGPNAFGFDNPSSPAAFIDKDRQFFTQIVNSFQFVESGGITDQTYSSTNLGINFKYSPIASNGDKVLIKEVENKIYAYFEGQDMANADYIEVTRVDDRNNISEAMNKYVLEHYTKDDCLEIYNSQSEYPAGQKWELACASLDNKVRRHTDYLLYDKNNPTKFVSVHIDSMDQDGRVSSKNTYSVLTSDYQYWISTISFK